MRDVRRTVRQGLWIAVLVAMPIWLFLWNAEADPVAMGQEPALAAQAGVYVRWLQWAVLPFYGYIVLRSFIAAPGAAGLGAGRSWSFAVAFNAFANWCLIFGKLGFPAMGIAGSGLATTLVQHPDVRRPRCVLVAERRFRRYRIFGRFWRADWPRFRALVRLGLPIAGILAFEVTIFNAAALLMGLINAASLAAHAIAIQIASITFMSSARPQPGGDGARRPGLRRRQPDGITRAGWTAFVLGVGFMALTALIMLFWPQLLIGAFIDLDRPRQRPGNRAGRHVPGLCRAVPDLRRRAGGRARACCAACTTPRCR